MLFNSYAFIIGYLPVTMAGFFWIAQSSVRLAGLWLVSASLFFYGWWNPAFVVLILASITFNYALGCAIAHVRQKSLRQARYLTMAAVVTNLGSLAYYKYANFIIFNVSQLTGFEYSGASIILPLGISFFTFTQIAFLVDVYRGVAREYNFAHYTLFVTYFPHLIAGPLLHHKQMMPQFEQLETYKIDLHNISLGLTVFIFGLAKKVLLADQFALYANPVFDSVAQGGEPKLFEAWTGTLAYTFQLYFDFSGYSDMAIGLSMLFNIRLPLNFNSPYKAKSIIEFWRRWHMTLSAFLRDYLYVPLGGGRNGSVSRYLNLLVTMLLGGLWHGAGWNFLVWGGVHGAYLMINHLWRNVSSSGEKSISGAGTIVCVGLTFAAVVVAWVPFRAADLQTTLHMWAGMFGINGVTLSKSLQTMLPQWIGQFATYDGLMPLVELNALELIFFIAVGLTIVWGMPNTQELISSCQSNSDSARKPTIISWRLGRIQAVILGGLFSLSLLMISRQSEFLYFQF